MTILGSALTALSPEDITKLIVEYGPAIEALIQFIEVHQDEKKRAVGMDAISRGLRYASETGDTTQLEAALREHCGPDGCRIS